ncbi:hypothetical protein JN11_01677 [Mucilaginibacter frigoritolerans]|jgi:hypothetical protein|uniref:Uncharacterized protein n=1 Tax=Mucilaginibacter frigoritolerans TaxID=652788 RepID=A0A562U6U9_9SPHI|nr:hypothetical protein [Mucilaginibacter frigoritolerans]TWJ01526.1 hypothetical protein JN11_01677 [Mucilaginibacter frigoritolerans]
MKKLLLFPVLLMIGINLYGQSIKFGDLIYFTSLSNREVFDNLMRGNTFRQDYTMQVNGQEIESFKSIGARANIEKIEVGKYSKLNDGTMLRTVNYTSNSQQDIINMISQVKRYGLDLKFQGADSTNTIYLYDSNFYKVSIYLRRDQTSGMIEVKQKEYLGLD